MRGAEARWERGHPDGRRNTIRRKQHKRRGDESLGIGGFGPRTDDENHDGARAVGKTRRSSEYGGIGGGNHGATASMGKGETMTVYEKHEKRWDDEPMVE